MIGMGLLLGLLSGVANPPGDACLTVAGERITALDLAPAWEALRNLPGGTAFGYAPAPGARRMFYAPELARLAARYEVPPPGAPICVQRAMQNLTREQLLPALRAALQLPGARVEISEYSRYPVPRGELEFSRAGLASPTLAQPDAPVLWKGYVRYAGGRRCSVWARVRIFAPMRRVVAVESLASGQPVRAAQLRIEAFEGFPLRRAGADALEQVVGKIPRRTIPAGAPVALELLNEPHTVQRGDEVAIEVDTGGARLAFTGRAESAGRRGQIVSVRNLASGKTFAARVAEKGRVTVTVKKLSDDKQ